MDAEYDLLWGAGANKNLIEYFKLLLRGNV
jgi:hypothetical protein